MKINKRFKRVNFAINKCRCGSLADFMIFKYRVNEQLDVEYNFVFVCADCYLKIDII